MRARPRGRRRRRGGRRQSVFHAVSGGVASRAGSVVNDCNNHRQSVDHQRSVFDDAAGNSTGIVSAPCVVQTSAAGYGQIYIGFVNWALMALTLGLAWVSFLRQSRRRIRGRGLADHAIDVGTHVPGHAGDIELELAAQLGSRRGCSWSSISAFVTSQYDEDHSMAAGSRLSWPQSCSS